MQWQRTWVHSRTAPRIRCACFTRRGATQLTTVVQADSYLELLVPHRIDILKSSARLGRQLLSEYAGVEYEELAVEIAVRRICQTFASVLYMSFAEDHQMVQLSQTLARLVKGNIHVMSNPTLDSTTMIVENAQRGDHSLYFRVL